MLTLPYKRVGDSDILLDVYLPSTSQATDVNPDQASTSVPIFVPAVVYFHGGGLTVGNRTSWFPYWLQRRINAAGCAFVSADYRLMPPASGHEILADVKDVFTFMSQGINLLLHEQHRPDGPGGNPPVRPVLVDPGALAVAGTSSGGLCAYLASMHASPKPRALLSMYGQGGNFMTHHYLTPKTQVFFRGREMLDPQAFAEFLYPRVQGPTPPPTYITDSPLAYHPPSSPTPGWPANPRMPLARLYLQMGVFLDYFTGQHDPSFSESLRDKLLPDQSEDANDIGNPLYESLRSLIPPRHLHLFPQFGITKDWPRTFLVHGSADTAVPAPESHHMLGLIQGAGVGVAFREVIGMEHSFDYDKNAEGTHAKLFDEVAGFLVDALNTSRNGLPN
ncbi:hypothetical protein JAAARDRAFT_171287 [Jaapia argillacea MUCL 33604]|uniref:Alpha/beta hydrolase fold-3 domain-containing protein n=1 Tax=Jaapia argillacea MUCL 33604 TaxID=933084 RepID=A0A067Q6N5_9AGAM|nr:hypothetical protein JAAARDRAFT_171287 [Jaapia argillacea MUCL 33604]